MKSLGRRRIGCLKVELGDQSHVKLIARYGDDGGGGDGVGVGVGGVGVGDDYGGGDNGDGDCVCDGDGRLFF